MTITLEKDGRLVLPAELRDMLHVGEGATLSAMLVGDHLELKPCRTAPPDSWPPGFFDRIAIDDPAFTRAPQGAMPPGVEL